MPVLVYGLLVVVLLVVVVVVGKRQCWSMVCK